MIMGACEITAGHYRVAGRRVPVVWSSPDLDALLMRRDCTGAHWQAYAHLEEPKGAAPFCSRIVLCASLARRDYPTVLLHELVHAWLWPSYRGRRSAFWTYEHAFISRLVPAMAATLIAAGWRPLPLPAGLPALARHARRVRARAT